MLVRESFEHLGRVVGWIFDPGGAEECTVFYFFFSSWHIPIDTIGYIASCVGMKEALKRIKFCKHTKKNIHAKNLPLKIAALHKFLGFLPVKLI